MKESIVVPNRKKGMKGEEKLDLKIWTKRKRKDTSQAI